jgi:DMSO/TMAO reductase YedYZ molybdopterin-dependent catalytic subunit
VGQGTGQPRIEPRRTSRTGRDAREDTASPAPGRRVVAGAVGLLTGVLALGVAQLVAGIVGGASSPMIAVGAATIDLAPARLKDFAIRTFGTGDKLALLVGIGVLLGAAAVAVGVASVRRPRAGTFGVVAFGLIGVVASLTRPANGLPDALPSVAGTLAGLFAYRRLRLAAGLSDPRRRAERTDDAGDAAGPAPAPLDRRRLLRTGGLAVVAAATSGVVGQYLVRRADAGESRAAVRIPSPADAAPPPPAGADLGVSGLEPFITPNDRFYRIDTALFVPSVSADGWSLRIHGMVEREITLDYRALVARPLIERDVTLACVSNEVGGPYIGNARWIGAPLRDVLIEAGVDPSASQLVSRSADGFTAGTPTAVVMDGRDAMLAVAMNGEPLPLEHGFPVRMVVPGLYGYVSATKWVVDLELTTFEAFDPYWIERGWASRAPIKTQSRIDTPGDGARVRPGEVAVAGVAWAQHRGIERVEVRVDDGPWLEAELAAEDTVDTWRQWVLRWNAPPGDHVLAVRATDGDGAVQVAAPAPPFPDGATGDHTIAVEVR